VGTAVRAKRLPSELKFKLVENKREVSGRPSKRGLTLLVLLLIAASTIAGQPAQSMSSETAGRLKQQIQKGSSEEKRSALSEIRKFRSPEASSIAVPALRDADLMVRATATASVVYLPKKDAARALIPLLSDKDEFVRQETAYALGRVGDASSTANLISSMQRDKSRQVRTAAAVALGSTGDMSAVESLLAILRTRPREDDEFLRRSAARSIGQIAQIIETGDRSVLTPQNYLPDKYKKLDNSSTTPAGFGAAVPVLISVLQNTAESDDSRREAAFALGAIGDEKAVPTLRMYVSSSDTYMAEIAREALAKIDNRKKKAASDKK
jgi:HEAT repeat protein